MTREEHLENLSKAHAKFGKVLATLPAACLSKIGDIIPSCADAYGEEIQVPTRIIGISTRAEYRKQVEFFGYSLPQHPNIPQDYFEVEALD